MDFLNCQWDKAKFLIFSGNVYEPLIYYSHLFPLVASLLLGFFVYFSNRKSLVNKLFLLLTILFSTWVYFDLILWASEKIEYIMFFWALIIPIEFFIFVVTFILVKYFINSKTISEIYRTSLVILLLPIIFFSSSKYALTAFDFTNCDRAAIEGPLINYLYAVEFLIFIVLLIDVIFTLIKNKENRKKNTLFSIGALTFLGLFIVGNVTIVNDMGWGYEQYKLFGMAFFLAIIVFLIVKFKTFNIKLIGAQALVWALVIFIGSQFLYMNQMPLSSLIITGITLILSAVIGLMIVRGIKKEIAIRERIETLAEQLELTNEKLRILDQQKTQFVSLTSHQLRAPLTSIKGYLSMILEGDYGEVKGEAREMIKRVEVSANNLVTVVGDFLDVSRIEQGKMRYEWTDFDLKPLVETVYREQQPIAEKKGLKLNVNIEEHMEYKLHGDMNKLKQVFTNLTDNSIKYTTKGEVDISLSRPSPKIIRFEIKDTGIGINAETLPRLFDKFVRAEGANEVNVIGTGLGLFVAKEMVKAHEGGKIWAESEGLGKGSRFVVELKAM